MPRQGTGGWNCVRSLSTLAPAGGAISGGPSPRRDASGREALSGPVLGRRDGEPLAPLARLVGPTWVAAFPDGETTDTQAFTWMLGGKFLRNVHRVRNAAQEVVYEGETVYAWDPGERKVLWWYFNSTGGYLTGELSIEGDLVHLTGVNHAEGSQVSEVKGEMRLEEDGWSSTSYFRSDGEWRERFTLRFRPKG